MKPRDPLLAAFAVLLIAAAALLIYSLRSVPPAGLLIVCTGILAGCLLPLR